MKRLLDLTAKELLDKLGSGNHIPGSGSAAAWNGLMACKLLSTVIQLTLAPSRGSKYKDHQPELTRISIDINTRIYPRLERLFQDDSDQFDKVINKRRQRDGESNQSRREELERDLQNELVIATRIPFEIAKLGIDISRYSVYVFDNGFKSARGDTSVALFNSLASIAGSLSIISLNMQSIINVDTASKINKATTPIQSEYDKLKEKSIEQLDILSEEAKLKRKFYIGLDKIKDRLHNRLIIENNEIEKLAKDIQNFLWQNKNSLWPSVRIQDPIEILDPQKVIKILKYKYTEVETLGVNDSNQEIAGIINNEQKEILIAKIYTKEIRNFTTAHELGHALMHNDIILHRDMPLDGSNTHTHRPKKEIQADKFAAFFLMPEKLLRNKFKDIFYVDYLEINNETAQALYNCSPSEFRRKVKSRREFSRFIASLKFYSITPIEPISSIFNVSIEAMAIRLEELDLVKF